MSGDLAIADAIAWTILQTNITPQTTIDPAHAAPIGATSITVLPVFTADGRSRFVDGGMLTWRDGTTEEELPISSVSPDGRTIGFDFTGLGYNGLQSAHLGGALVTTNVFSWVPWDIADMLNTGDPVVYVAAVRKRTPQQIQRGTFPVYQAHLQYHRQLYRPGQQLRMDPNAWARRQDKAARTDLEAIERAILSNSHLSTDHAPASAKRLGVDGSSEAPITTHWDKIEVEKDTWHFFATQDILVTGTLERTGPQPLGG